MDAPSPAAIKSSDSQDQETANPVAGLDADVGSDTDTDPLLACLEFLTQFYQTPHSAAVLRAGLPLGKGHVTPSLFVRAAARAGLVGRVVRRPLKNISKLELPVVAILNGDQACVVVERSAARGKKQDTVSVMMPEAGGGVQEFPLADLADRFAGYVIYARPAYHFEASTSSTGDERPRRWFWGVMARNWAVYGHVALAAVFVNLFALATPLFIMTVYDRVVPNNAIDTLLVLAIGVGLVYAFEFAVKTLRGYYIDVAGKRADVALASNIFDHVLDIQMASRPASAGGFANTLREFETVRDFFASATLATLVDLPFIALFIGVIWMIGGPIAVVPAIAVPVVITVGLLIQIPLNRVVREGFGPAVRLGRHRNFRGVLDRIRRSDHRRFDRLCHLEWPGGGQFVPGRPAFGALASSQNFFESLDAVMKMPVERPRDRHFLHRPKLDGKVQFKGVTYSYPGQVTPALRAFRSPSSLVSGWASSVA